MSGTKGKLVGWGEVRNPNINKVANRWASFIQPNLRVVAIEDDAVLGGSMGGFIFRS
ncbi:hypothetical protein [Nitrosomonas sp.]|uniref:hypothetical protein n=1 Tax=Nitrosomonas sp. TaxID=42353 RepID=UPI00374DA39E